MSHAVSPGAVALRSRPGLTGSGSHRYSYGGSGEDTHTSTRIPAVGNQSCRWSRHLSRHTNRPPPGALGLVPRNGVQGCPRASLAKGQRTQHGGVDNIRGAEPPGTGVRGGSPGNLLSIFCCERSLLGGTAARFPGCQPLRAASTREAIGLQPTGAVHGYSCPDPSADTRPFPPHRRRALYKRRGTKPQRHRPGRNGHGHRAQAAGHRGTAPDSALHRRHVRGSRPGGSGRLVRRDRRAGQKPRLGTRHGRGADRGNRRLLRSHRQRLDRPGFFGGLCLPDAINLLCFPAVRSSFPHILSGECTCRRSAGARCYTRQPIPGSRA